MKTTPRTARSILEHPQAQALLRDATVSAAAVRGCQGRLTGFLRRYLPRFYRREQRVNARIVVEGLLSSLERKTCEPIARAHGVQRKPIQFFVGNGKWDDAAVMAELRRHVREAWGDPHAVLVIDPSTFPKKGADSCGVARQWCGRLGKLDNCQAGVFLCYAAAGGHAPLDRQLYLPADWAADPQRRQQCHVPADVTFQEKWRIGLAMVDRCRAEGLPHGWVAGDDEMGRASVLRRELRARQEPYVLDVPGHTLIHDLRGRPLRRRRARRGRRCPSPFVRVEKWAAQQPASRWRSFTVRAGEKGPLQVRALSVPVRAMDEQQHVGPPERLLVVRTLGAHPQTSYSLSNVGPGVPLAELVRVHAQRHRIEQMFAEGKGEAGLAHYEVRSWVGWHHHMTLALLALWFLGQERRRVAGGKTGRHRGPNPGGLRPLAPPPPARLRRHRPPGQRRPPPHRGGPHL
jgi:SRSO17 transposase